MTNENMDKIREKLDMDRKIIAYLDSHITDRVNIEYKVRALEFHRAVLTLIERAKEEGIFGDIPSTLTAEDIFTMFELGLFSDRQENQTESK